jgi:nitrite reductase (NO-forming)
VALVHRQTRHGLSVAAAFTAAAILSAASGLGTGWWLPLHLFVVGGLLSAISATTQMLAVTWSAAPATPPALAATQRSCLAGGAVAMVSGREADVRWLFVAGSVAVVVAVAGLVPILWRIRRGAVADRFHPAIDGYVAACAAGALGMSIGIVLGVGHGGSRTVELRSAHLLLNLFGLVGLVIAATLPYFAATQVRSRMSPRATAPAMRGTVLVLIVATAVAVLGRLLDQPAAVAVGLCAYAAALVGVAVRLPIYGRKRLVWAGARAVQLLAGLAWWAAMAVALGFAGAGGRDDRPILQALVLGGFAQILAASLAYLGPVLRGGAPQRLSAGFAATRSWLSLAALNVAAAGALAGRHRIVVAALLVWLVDAVLRAVRLLSTNQEHVPHV